MKRSGTVIINADDNVENEVTETNKIRTESIKETPKRRSTDHIVPGQREINELQDLVEDENKVLYEISSVFPFQIFPDKIIVHPTKVMVVHRGLFYKHVFPMLIRDINTVTVSRGLLFASIHFEIRSYEENPGIINFLWPEHASQAEAIILGLLSAIRDRGIDITKVPLKKARQVIRKLGESKIQVEKML